MGFGQVKNSSDNLLRSGFKKLKEKNIVFFFIIEFIYLFISNNAKMELNKAVTVSINIMVLT